MAGSLLARTIDSLCICLACGLLSLVLLCISSSVDIRRMDKGLTLTSSLLPKLPPNFTIQTETCLLTLSHLSHFCCTWTHLEGFKTKECLLTMLTLMLIEVSGQSMQSCMASGNPNTNQRMRMIKFYIIVYLTIILAVVT